MSYEAQGWAFAQSLSALEKMTLMALASRHNADTNRCDPSLQRMSEDCGMSIDCVRTCIAGLASKGLIKTVDRSLQGMSHSFELNFSKTIPIERQKRGGLPVATPRLRARGGVGNGQGEGGADSHPKQEVETVNETHVEETSTLPQLVLLEEGKEQLPPTPLPMIDDVVRDRLFPYYLERTGRTPARYPLTPARLKQGVVRLRDCVKRTEGNKPEALSLFLQAIDGLAENDYLMGRDPKTRGKRYCEWGQNLCVESAFDKRLSDFESRGDVA